MDSKLPKSWNINEPIAWKWSILVWNMHTQVNMPIYCNLDKRMSCILGLQHKKISKLLFLDF